MTERWYRDEEWDLCCDTRFADEEEHSGSCPTCGRITFEKVMHSEEPSWDEKHEIGDLGGSLRVRYCPWCGWEDC